MKTSATGSSMATGYNEPPWKFQGSALYQFHLVKSEVARALIPKEFRLVEAFGYTLGGFFLASYEDSPAGVFDELVVIAGIVWNPPTSCAWASRVLVSSNEACLHGRKDIGLPSYFARFSKSLGIFESRVIANMTRQEDKANGFLRRIGVASERSSTCSHTATEVTELRGPAFADVFSISLINTGVLTKSFSVPGENSKTWMGPSVKMSLPSFSGRTEYNPSLLKYSCQMACRVRLVRPLRVTTSRSVTENEAERQSSVTLDPTTDEPKTDPSSSHLSLLVMLSKPVLALELNRMNMNVEAPLVISK